MLRLTITVGGSETDYTQNVPQESLKFTEGINIPSQLSFSLLPIGAGFVVPPRHGYVRLYSTVYDRSIFTGYIIADPTREYVSLGAIANDNGGQIFHYKVDCVSDDVLLNSKAVPFIPAFINRTQGQILADIADALCPGFFDTSMCMSGDIVPVFEYSPTQSFTEIAKQFGDGSRYRYKARDKQIWYVPYGDEPLGIVYDETQAQGKFAPKGLKTTVLNVPVVNDVTIIGDVEAGNNHEDYFLGDGFTGNFPLKHKVFKGATTTLVQETWNNSSLNTQQWYLNDPGSNFDLSVGALNVISPTGVFTQLGQSYLQLNNGLEIAGSLDLEVGEITFNDYARGVLGGIYTDTTFSLASLLAGWNITTPGSVTTGASGAGGIKMQPWFSGNAVGPSFISEPNHNYVLQMVISAPQYARYTRTYRTIEGEPYGGGSTTTLGSITFIIQDLNIAAASGLYYQPEITKYTVPNVNLPAFVVWALINNISFTNMTITNSLVAQMPLGTLEAHEGPSGLWSPTGAILPMLPPGNGGYVGPVLPWPSSASGDILAAPAAYSATGTLEPIGFPANLTVAQVTPGNTFDTLGFYVQTLPAAGTPVRFQSWESQAAVSRLQNQASIEEEKFVVGDDGIRSAIITDLNPNPRTSEDCDNAALAFLADRTGVFYNGNYTIESGPTFPIFTPLTSDVQLWPTTGRFLNINAPRRKIFFQKYLVTKLEITVLDMKTETLRFSIGFGADMYLEKVLKNFVDLRPNKVLTSTDKANPPNPRYTQDAASSYLPDLNNVQVQGTSINAQTAAIQVLDNYIGPIEVRRIDANWGKGPTPDYIATVTPPVFNLARIQYDQTWYMRPVQSLGGTGTVDVTGIGVRRTAGIPFAQWPQGTRIRLTSAAHPERTNTFTVLQVDSPSDLLLVSSYGFVESGVTYAVTYAPVTSRRSKVIRIRYPQIPLPPILVSQTGSQLQFGLNGDVRNLYGFELRASESNIYTGVVDVTGIDVRLVSGSAFNIWPAGTQIRLTSTAFPERSGLYTISVVNNGTDLFLTASYGFVESGVTYQVETIPVLAQTTVGSPQGWPPVIDMAVTPFVTLPAYGEANWHLLAYFFNNAWEYSEALDFTVPNGTQGLQVVQVSYTPAI